MSAPGPRYSAVEYALNVARTRLRDLIERTPGDEPRRDQLFDVLNSLTNLIRDLERIRVG